MMSQEVLSPVHEQIENEARALDWLANGCVLIAGAALVSIVIVEAWQVFARYVLNDSPSWTEPVALLLMSTALMLGAAAGVRAQKHFGFALIVERAPQRVAGALRTVHRVIAGAVGLMLALWGAEMVADAWDYAMPGAPLPQGAAYLPVCIGGTLILVFSLEQLFARRQRAPNS
jgi:TRAP-type C4-dicarboxylate transport system permease small subunit